MQAADASNHAGRLTTAQIRNLCVGLFGVQVVWGLQNVNTSRIFQTLGADIAELPMLWIAAPITGLLIQPLIGHWSDRLRSRWGRRRPFILVGTVLTALAMLAMAAATTLTAAVIALWLLTAAVNIAMQPFRALAADQVPPDQRARGFAMQVCFIGAGAVFASALPWMLVNWFGIAGVERAGVVPASVQLAFQLGAIVLVVTVGWTLLRVREAPAPALPPPPDPAIGRTSGSDSASDWASISWVAAGLALAVTAWWLGMRREIYLIAALAVGYGTARLAAAWRSRRGLSLPGPLAIIDDIAGMPRAMRSLALTQFLTWFGLFAMWVYAVPAIALRHYDSADPSAVAYNVGADWVGVLFALYDGVAALAALALPLLIARVGLRAGHAICLLLGALGLGGFLVVDDPQLLWVPAIGIGIAWASILATPYVMVANAVPAHKVGVYMGIHNTFLVIPQLVAAACLGAVVDRLTGGRADAMLALAAGALALAALSALRIPTAAESDSREVRSR